MGLVESLGKKRLCLDHYLIPIVQNMFTSNKIPPRFSQPKDLGLNLSCLSILGAQGLMAMGLGSHTISYLEG